MSPVGTLTSNKRIEVHGWSHKTSLPAGNACHQERNALLSYISVMLVMAFTVLVQLLTLIDLTSTILL